MTLILSIETATNICSVAIHKEAVILASSDLFLEKSHSGSLALVIEQLLAHCDLQFADLSAVSVSGGPGSYTGLRIGLSTAKGLCYALNIPLISISSLDSMSAEVSNFVLKQNCLLIPMIDARRMEVFYKINRPDLQELKPLSNLILSSDSFGEYAKGFDLLYLFGNGAAKAAALLGNKGNFKLIENVNPSAKFMGRLAFDKFQAKDFEDLAYFEPNYGKEFFSPVSKKKSFL